MKIIIVLLFSLTTIISCVNNKIYKTKNSLKLSKRNSYYQVKKTKKISKKKNSHNLANLHTDTNTSQKIFYMTCSFYGKKFQGKVTSNGEIFDMNKFTCANKTLPFGTILKVTDEDSGLSVKVRVNDRGPFIPGRDLDLSRAAAEKIGLTKFGVKKLKIEIIAFGD